MVAISRGIRLVGKLEECDSCGAVKVKAAPIPKSTDSDKKAKDIGERLFVDITGPFPLTATTNSTKLNTTKYTGMGYQTNIQVKC